MNNPKHPIQPIITTPDGIQRFKPNPMVRYLLDTGNIDLNHLSRISNGLFEQNDWEQLNQLIGYSVSGFLDTNPSLETAATVTVMAENTELTEDQARIEYLRGELSALRQGMVTAVARLFDMSEEDLKDSADMLDQTEVTKPL